MTRTPAGNPEPHGVPDEPAHDPEVAQLAGQLPELARQGATDTVAAYVDAGAPADLSDDHGEPLVVLAARHGHAATAAALLERGADPDRPGRDGRTALAAATARGDDAVVDVLLHAGADPAAGSPSALETARAEGRDGLVERFGPH